MRRILIAGMGNILRRDDGFGVEVAKRLANREEPLLTDEHGHVKVIEVGIGGIHLAQELMAGYDLLVVVDAIERGSAPGTVHILEAEVSDLAEWPEVDRQDFLADMHYATPSKALILAKALDCLPPKVFIVGCQPADAADIGIGLSDPVEQAIGAAVREIEKIVGVRERQLPAKAQADG
jgi:hydrogenase maturation protease